MAINQTTNYPVPTRAIRVFVNYGPSRLIIGQRGPHNSLHYERLKRRPPVLPGYEPSLEMGPESHITITTPTRGVRTRLLIREHAVSPGGTGFMVTRTRKIWITPPLASGILNDSGRYDSASTEAGVLVARLDPSPRGTYYQLGGGTQSTTITIATGEASSCLLIRQQLISVHSRCLSPWDWLHGKTKRNILRPA
ncbi:hypothetical protein AVEN_31345-1 [Araneus ventricosus]|uniref:Uncharacterized protein n=1 Tax=Araneus ventricosus TaxID=182803 RepID=A0A4Y2F950_ARAVE|nr:hypothetical protein AVEN_31345-1 [Araneus ventricosus]